MLGALKDAAWGPMNSYVHTGIHPVIQHHAGFPPEYALQVLLNSNGLSGMAATLMAIITDDARIAADVRNAQLSHLDCLPPISGGVQRLARSCELAAQCHECAARITVDCGSRLSGIGPNDAHTARPPVTRTCFLRCRAVRRWPRERGDQPDE
jgi:hypothetical protein